MNNYSVESGSMKVSVSARNHKMAVIKAIDENNPSALGLLVSCRKEGDSEDDEVYMKTENVLNDMGFEIEEK